MQVVIADIGNSAIKVMLATLDPKKRTALEAWPSAVILRPGDLANGERLMDKLPSPIDQAVPWVAASVNAEHLRRLHQFIFANRLASLCSRVTWRQVAIDVNLPDRDAVGIDRLLAAEAASRLYGAGRDVIVIDCGTALTIDLIDSTKTFQGGVIIAGPATNLRALADMTAALPELSQSRIERPPHLVGKSTREAMLAGAWLNGLGAIRETVTRFSAERDLAPVVVGTGGGLGPWRSELPEDWTIADDLVIEGLLEVALELHCTKRESCPNESSAK